MALCGRSYFLKLQAIGWAYWAAIMVGSVYLGWHYALDGIAGSLFAYGLFVTAGTLVRARIATQPPALTPAIR